MTKYGSSEDSIDHMEHFNVPEEWYETPLVRIEDGTVCMPYLFQSYLIVALTRVRTSYEDEMKVPGSIIDRATRQRSLVHIRKFLSLLEHMPECK